MKSLTKIAVATASLTAAGLIAAPADAQVHIGIGLPGVHVGVGVGVPAPAYYYGPGYYPPGPCDAYNYYYGGDCGYAVYTGPIVIAGIAVGGPHYYRWYDGRPYFWYRGGWHFWNGWTRVNFGWDHDEGFGWHDGRWDRDYGNAHWHGGRGPGRGHGDFRGDRGDHHGDRGDHGGDRGGHHGGHGDDH